MAMKVAATYTNGAFVPDKPVDMDEGARAYVEVGGDMAALDEAERIFALAFAGGALDEARVKEGCKIAWDAARASVVKAARVRGWAHDTDEDLTRAVCQLDGIGENGRFEGALRYYSPYCAAEIFRDRAYADEGDIAPLLLDEPWHFADGLRATRALIRALADASSE